MTTNQPRRPEGTRPLVAVVCDVPLLGEAVRSTIEFADVQTFAARNGNLDGLLRWLRPDAVIVDSADGAEQATAFAAEHDLEVLHVSVESQMLRLYRKGAWHIVGTGDGPTPDMIRNVVAGALFQRKGARR